MAINRAGWLSAALLAALAPLSAHHSLAAQYDDKKPVTLKGVVTKFDWANPHVYLFLDVADTKGTESWAVELESRIELKRIGWTGDSVSIGDSVTVEGNPARDGSKQINGKSVWLASGKKLSAVSNGMVAHAKSTQPVPRWTNGHVRLGPAPGETGYWANPSTGGLVESTAGNIRISREGLLANIADADKVAPFVPWAKGLYIYRQRNLLKDDPMASCLPPGGPRQFQAPYGLQIVEQPERQRIFVMSGGGNRNWRLINLDARALPEGDDVSPTYYGHSVGRWEGDTLVIDSVAFNERFWFTNGGLPHTESMKLRERISRPDFNTLKYEVTVTDPGAYTRPWTASFTLEWIPGQEIEEYFCDDYNRDGEKGESK
jgi:Family of unknown function (DUF6152)